VRVFSWNLFHGRAAPPEPGLATWRSRVLGVEERGATHVQVNRSLLEAFVAVLAREPWDVALLQEVPPRWLRTLCRGTGADGASALTSRNLGAGARAWLADRRPDLLASWEGGSNQTLVRGGWRIDRVRRLTLVSRPERRRLLWTALRGPDGRELAVANLHASVSDRHPERDVLRAADHAIGWAGPAPLIFGGDLNVRPAVSPELFEHLRSHAGLAPPAAPDSVDHVLGRGVDLLEAPRLLPPERREIERAGMRRLRLSDHAVVTACFGVR